RPIPEYKIDMLAAAFPRIPSEEIARLREAYGYISSPSNSRAVGQPPTAGDMLTQPPNDPFVPPVSHPIPHIGEDRLSVALSTAIVVDGLLLLPAFFCAFPFSLYFTSCFAIPSIIVAIWGYIWGRRLMSKD